MISRADKLAPPPRTRTFDEVCSDHRVTASERADLVWFLATFRMRKTVETLLPGPYVEPWLLDVLRDSG